MTAARRLLSSLLLLLAFSASAAERAVPPPRDVAYPGLIALDVDVSDVDRRLMRVHERIPVKAGRLTLLYPQWQPGHHAPRGPIEQLAGLTIAAAGKALPWRRDPLDVFAFHVDVPAGVGSIDVDFQIATPLAEEQGRVVFTSQMVGLQWVQTVLYPAGYYSRGIRVAPRLRLPSQWRQASALRPLRTQQDGDEYLAFEPVTLEVLIDSPVFAGRHFAQIDLAPGAAAPITLNVVADAPGKLAATPQQIDAHRAMVSELLKVFGAPHFDHYEYLLALSDDFGGIGLEHHRSSENSRRPGYFVDADEALGDRNLLAHEFTHSWNGKYRRPADLWTPNYNVPMQDSLLWVYEGMTDYYGLVLTARAGLWSQDFGRELFAAVAGTYDRKRPGRAWRPLVDTTHQPIMNPRQPMAWTSWQRSEEYYGEGSLIWLEVDAQLRRLTAGRRSLDDMVQSFVSAPANQGIVSTYTFADVVRALDAIAPHDWRAMLERRVDGLDAPLEGVARAGWKLVYDERPNASIADGEKQRKLTDLSYSIGVTLTKDGVLADVIWDGPAYKAGLARNSTLIAVNGQAYSADLLKEAIRAAKLSAVGAPATIDLLVKTVDRYRTVQLDYRGGLLYPHLERVEGTADLLADIFKSRR